MTTQRATTRWLWLAIAALAAAAAIVFVGGRIATRAYLNDAAVRGQTTLNLAIAALDGHMSRFEPLPALIADHDDIKALVADPDNAALRDDANRYLKEINGLLKSSDIYVMLPDGDTIAASNYDGPLSFVGENFSYRPYFQDAIAGRPGRFFALGTTSLKRGYYFSSPIRVETASRASSFSRSISMRSRRRGGAATTRSSSPIRKASSSCRVGRSGSIPACCR